MRTYDKYKFSGIDWIGDLPYEWQILPLKYLVSTKITDGPHETPQILVEGVPFVSAESVRDGKIDFNLKRGYISEEQDLIYSKKCKPKRNDIFIIKSGSTTGNIAFVDFDDNFNIWSPLALVRTNIDKAFSRYIFHFLQTDFFQDQVRFSWSFGTQPNIGMNVIENLKIIVPTISEQTAIADYLDEKTAQIDKLITEKRGLTELLKEERLGVINQAVTRGINPHAKLKPSGIAWLGDIPEHWVIVSIGYRFEVQLGKMLDEKRITGKHLAPYLRNTDVQWQKINTNDLPVMDFTEDDRSKFSLKYGDLLVCEGGEVGRCAIWKEEISDCFYQKALHRIRPVNKERDSTEFLFYLMLVASERGLFTATGNSNIIQHLPAEKLRKHQFPFPPIEEQKQIVEFIENAIDKIDATITTIEKEIGFLGEYRTALISEVVTGKIKVI